MPVDEIARFTLAQMPLDEALERHGRLRDALLKVAGDGAVVVEAIRKNDPPRELVNETESALTLLRPTKRQARR